MQHTEALEEPLFKVNKRRKAYRQRVNKDDEVAFTASASATPILSSPDEVPVESRRAETTSDTTISMAEILKARKTRKSHARGVAFGIPPTTSSQQVFPLPEIEDEASHQDDAEGGSGLRFSKQRGILGDVNKHMYVIIRSGIDSMDGVTETNQARMAYIESEIARQRQAGEPTTHASTNNEPVISHDVSQPQKQAVTLGKIQEIDLGDEPRDRNASMTERARRMAIGETSSDHDQAKKPSKSRLGPDGKPWRDRKRRASDDIKRDFIVDEFLRENKSESSYKHKIYSTISHSNIDT